jgi:colicin import membrane protein
VVHLLAVSAMFLLPNLSAQRTYYSPVYSVRLVNLPPASGAAEERKPAGASEPLPAASSRPEEKVKTKEKPLSTAPKEETEKRISDAIERVRKRKAGKNLDDTLDRMRRQQEEKRVDAAIDRLRSDRETRQVNSAIEGIRRKVMIGSSGAVESPSGTGGASGVMSIKFKMYYNLIWQRIRSAWVLPEGALKGRKDLETIISIRIARDGQIEDIQFEKKSGNAALDESALRAIKKANPLPPLPPGMEGEKFDVGVRFSPSEL